MKKKGSGQALVEFALVAPVLLMLLIGILEFGRVIGQYFALSFVMQDVSTDAARRGGYGPELDLMLQGHQFPWLDADNITYDVNTQDESGLEICSTGDCLCDYGDYVVVESQYPTGLRILFFKADLTLKTRHILHCWRGGAP
jgi:hypothetical protein